MNLISKLLFTLFVLAATACATRPVIPTITPPEQSAIHKQHLASLADIQAFSLKGRLGVVTQKQGFSGGIAWQHEALTDNIDVYSPLGSKIANIVKTSNQVILTDEKGRSTQASTAETLTETTLGFRLPINGLSDWAVGRPTDSKIEASSWDAQGRLTTLKQDGWDIGFENYLESNGTFLPTKIVLKSDKVNLKLLVEKWLNTQ